MAIRAVRPPTEGLLDWGFVENMLQRSVIRRGHRALAVLLALSVVLAIPIPETSAQSTLCGEVSTNTTLTAGGGPYHVTCPVTVPAGVILTVEAGAVVKFDPATSLTVYGVLQSLGSAGTPVVFTSHRDDEYGGDSNGDGPSAGQPGDWGGLNLEIGSYTLSGCLLRYAGLVNLPVPAITASAGFTGTIANNTIYAPQPWLNLSPFGVYSGYGISLAGSATATNNTITFLSKWGGYPTGIRAMGSQARITDNAISGAGTGILVLGSTTGEVARNVVTNAAVGVVLSSVAVTLTPEADAD